MPNYFFTTSPVNLKTNYFISLKTIVYKSSDSK